MSKLNIALMYGGRSGEHEVSLLSASSVLAALDKQKYNITCLGGDKQGQWHETPAADLFQHDDKQPLPVITATSKKVALATDYFTDINVVLPIMHGPLFEDGCLQGFLELCDVAYVGSGHLSSAMAMDKAVTKILAQQAGVTVAPFVVLRDGDDEVLRQSLLERAISEFGFPLFVKPACLGSSVGTHRVETETELAAAITDAFCYDAKVLVEQAIIGREIELAVLKQAHEIMVSTAGEIIVNAEGDFYSYQAKYVDKQAAQLVIPASLSSQQLSDLQQQAKLVFNVLDCEGMARVDFFLDLSGNIVLNEINTLPGFTEISMYPKLWQSSGIEYPVLLNRLIEQALWRHQKLSQRVRDFL